MSYFKHKARNLAFPTANSHLKPFLTPSSSWIPSAALHPALNLYFSEPGAAKTATNSIVPHSPHSVPTKAWTPCFTAITVSWRTPQMRTSARSAPYGSIFAIPTPPLTSTLLTAATPPLPVPMQQPVLSSL